MPLIHDESRMKSSTILTFPKIPKDRQKHVFSAQLPQNEQIGTKSGLNRAQIGTKSAEKTIKHDLLAMVAALEQQQESANCAAKSAARQLLCQADVAEKIREEGVENAVHYALGIHLILEQCQAGKVINAVQLLDDIAAQHNEPSKNFLKEKVVPLFKQYTIWIKQSDNKYRWIQPQKEQDKESPAAQLDQKVTVECQWSATSPLKSAAGVLLACRQIFQRRHAKKSAKITQKAKADPYLKIDKTGAIQQLSKPFQGELSEQEKKLIRAKEKAEAEAKIIRLTDQFKNIKLLRENAEFEQSIQQQVNELHAQAALEAAEIHARQAVQKAKLQSYKPLAVVFIILLIVLFIANTQPTPLDIGSQTFGTQTIVWEQN